MPGEFGIDFGLVFFHFYQLGIAFILALPIAFNREHGSRGARGAGLRTFPLVTIASCAFMYGIITGIGFIGGGAIVKESGRVGGTATAAGIWITGAIGISVAYARYEIAICLSIMSFIIFQFFSYFKRRDIDEDKI
jgi:putative Mg2+ transporter-C (MgtC) family protein